MSPALDGFLVAAALAVSAAYALFALGPRSWRRRALTSVAAWTARLLPASGTLRRVAARLEAAASAKSAGACGGCGTCGDDAPVGASSAAPGEVKVPLAKIGRRTS